MGEVGIVIMFVEIVGRVTMIGDTSAMCACITEVAWFQDEGTGAPSPTVGLRTPTPPSRNRPKGGGGERTGDKSNEEGLPVSFKTYRLLGPPNSWNNRLTPASPAPDGLPYSGKNHAMLSNGCYTFSLQGAQQLITPTNPRSYCD